MNTIVNQIIDTLETRFNAIEGASTTFGASDRSESRYITIYMGIGEYDTEYRGYDDHVEFKIRVSSHDLPGRYEQPDFDIGVGRISDLINSAYIKILTDDEGNEFTFDGAIDEVVDAAVDAALVAKTRYEMENC